MAHKVQQGFDEFITIFYGLNPKTFDIETVWQTRGNMLLRKVEGTRLRRRRMPYGMRPHDAAALMYGLTDVLPIPVAAHDSEPSKMKIAELRRKALRMKLDALAIKKSGK